MAPCMEVWGHELGRGGGGGMRGLLGMQGEMDGERMGEGELEELEERYWERERRESERERRESDRRMHHQEEVEGVGVGVGVSERGGGLAAPALSSVPPPPPNRPHLLNRHHQVAICRLPLLLVGLLALLCFT